MLPWWEMTCVMVYNNILYMERVSLLQIVLYTVEWSINVLQFSKHRILTSTVLTQHYLKLCVVSLFGLMSLLTHLWFHGCLTQCYSYMVLFVWVLSPPLPSNSTFDVAPLAGVVFSPWPPPVLPSRTSTFSAKCSQSIQAHI